MTNETFAKAVEAHSDMSADGNRGLTYQGLELTYDISPSSMLLVVHQGTSAQLLLAPESDYTRQADSLGVSEESKIGSSEFDGRYVIRDAHGKAKEVLTPDVVALVEELAPFVELELLDDMIRLLKKPVDEKAALESIEALVRLSQALAG